MTQKRPANDKNIAGRFCIVNSKKWILILSVNTHKYT